MHPSPKPTPERLIHDDPSRCEVKTCMNTARTLGRTCDPCFADFCRSDLGWTDWLAEKESRPALQPERLIPDDMPKPRVLPTPEHGFSSHVEVPVITPALAEAARAMGYDVRVGDPVNGPMRRLHTGETLRAVPLPDQPELGARVYREGIAGVYVVTAWTGDADPNVRNGICFSVDVELEDGARKRLRGERWPGEWKPAPPVEHVLARGTANPSGAPLAKLIGVDPAPGPDYTGHTYAVRDPLSVACEASASRNRMRRTFLAFSGVAVAMSTRRGQRVLAAQAVEDAVRACPAGLVPEAYRAALIFHFETVKICPEADLHVLPRYLASHAAKRGTPPGWDDVFAAYDRALAALRSKPLGRPARWSQGGAPQSATPRTTGVTRRFLPSESAETSGERRWGK